MNVLYVKYLSLVKELWRSLETIEWKFLPSLEGGLGVRADIQEWPEDEEEEFRLDNPQVLLQGWATEQTWNVWTHASHTEHFFIELKHVVRVSVLTNMIE